MLRGLAGRLVLGLTCAAAACGGSSPPPTEEPAGSGAATAPAADPFAVMADYKTKLCACTDKACAQPLVKELTLWSNKPEANVTGDADRERMNALAAETNECAKRALVAE